MERLKMKVRRVVRMCLLASSAAPAAYAHPGHGPADLSAGFLHPFTGLDHLLAMVAVGLWAAQLGGKGRYLLPLCFVSAMLAGAVAGIAGLHFGGIDLFVLASVFVLGVFLAGAVRMPLAAACAAVALAGAFHGLAHGAEMPLQSDGLRFLGGMVAGTTILHAFGVSAGAIAARRGNALRWAGAGVLACGLALLAG